MVGRKQVVNAAPWVQRTSFEGLIGKQERSERGGREREPRKMPHGEEKS